MPEEVTPELQERVQQLIEEYRPEDFETLERRKAEYLRGDLTSTDLTDTALRTLGRKPEQLSEGVLKELEPVVEDAMKVNAERRQGSNLQR